MEILAILLAIAGLASAEEVTVFAAASTTAPMTELVDRYRADTGRPVRLQLASSSTLARQIATGAPADVYLSANVKWMNYLQDHNAIIVDSRRDLLSNRLALVAPRGRAVAIRFDASFDLGKALAGRLATGDPEHVPAGIYGAEAMRALGWQQAMADRLIPCRDVMSALRLVEQNEADAGIVYATNAAGSDKVELLGLFPESTHTPIRYPVALTTGAKPEAKAFLDFLAGDEAAAIFARHGFFTCAGKSETAAPAPSPAPVATRWDLSAVMLSVKVASWCTVLLAGPAVAIGWLLARKSFPGKPVLSALVHVPLVIPPVATGYLLLLGLGSASPLGRWLHDTVGLDLAFHWRGAVLASAMVSLPLMVRTVRLAIEAVDRRLEQAANTMGATPLRAFFTVTLPLAGPGVLAGAVLAFARSLGEFGATITFAGNLPGATRTLPSAVYGYMQTPGGDPMAARLVAVSIALSLAAILLAELLAARAKARLAVL